MSITMTLNMQKCRQHISSENHNHQSPSIRGSQVLIPNFTMHRDRSLTNSQSDPELDVLPPLQSRRIDPSQVNPSRFHKPLNRTPLVKAFRQDIPSSIGILQKFPSSCWEVSSMLTLLASGSMIGQSSITAHRPPWPIWQENYGFC